MSLTAASYDDTTDVGNLADTSGAQVVNSSTGLLSKVADTAIDLAGLAGAKALGFTYPTGQTNPATVASQNTAAQQQAALTNQKVTNAVSNYMPYILLGVGAVAVIGIVVAIAAHRK